MQIRETLIAIANDARGWLQAWADDFTPAEALDSGGTRTHPLARQLGHIAAGQDDVHRLFAGGEPAVPVAVRAACGSGCLPPDATTAYPPLADLWELLDRTHERLVDLVERASDADLDRPPLEPSRFFTSLGQAVYEIALHENYHVGEIGALRRALGKPPIG